MPPEKIVFDYSVPKTLHIKLCGYWQISEFLPSVKEITAQLTKHTDITQVTFESSKINKWDSGLVSFLLQLSRECERKNIRVVREGLPPGVQKLLTLALAENGKKTPPRVDNESFIAKIGGKLLRTKGNVYSLIYFLGEITVSFNHFLKGKAYFRRDDFVFILQKCGADALALVSLISILVGMILAFIGAVQLKMFGAQVYIADIVGISMVRVMGAVMTGILMAGRTGASFAAELGIMQTNEEIDALRTLGVSPVEFLVLPRVLALTIMMPLLTVYADFMGILGGFVISTGMFGVNTPEYIAHTRGAVRLDNLWIGLIHSFIFGIIIAISGCLRGIKCERSAAGVGEAATSAVVTAITGIVIATAIITYICQVLGV